jgi:hypothetical protein
MEIKTYLSPSSFNRFATCSAAQLAVERGEWKPEVTAPMKIGSYVDSHFSGTLEKFKEENPDIYTKSGTLRADFVKAEEIISNIEADPVFLEYITGGEQQKKVHGIIGGVPFMGYIDSYIPGKAIVDLKVCKNVRDRVYHPHSHSWVTWIEDRGYIIQGAVYRELIRQMTGETLPFFIAAIDKQKYPDKEIIHIPEADLNEALAEVSERAKEFMKIRTGELPAIRCEKCDYCRSTKKLEHPISHLDLID